MATWYVDSTATGGTGAGTSWANACLTPRLDPLARIV